MGTDRGIEACANRLRHESAEIDTLKARLTGASRRRRLLALKLSTAGWSERAIGKEIGVSGAGVHQMLVVARREQEAFSAQS